MNPPKYGEPAIVDVGFMPNCWGGWWFTGPDNRFTIQILPSNTIHESRDWRLGIARQRHGMKWGTMAFPAPEAAALHACRVLSDAKLRDRITLAMEDKRLQHEAQAQRAINNFIKRKTPSNERKLL